MSTHFTAHVDARNPVEFHCEQENERHSYRIGGESSVYLGGTHTEVVEFGEACIRAAIGHAGPDQSEAVLWRDYLSVMLDRAERAVTVEQSIDRDLWAVS